ncbi:MAG: hypothetical protein WBM40_16675 [Thiohalocapsa sp.]|jgi:hypothetical protein
MNKDLLVALSLDFAGMLLMVVSMIGFTGILESFVPWLSRPGVYLSFGGFGLLLTLIAMPRVLRAARAAKAGRDKQGS